MRFRVKVTRVQSAERTVSGADEESAMRKIRDELERPFGFLGSWTDQGFEVEVLEVDSRVDTTGAQTGEGPMVFSVREGAKRLGVSGSVMYELVHSGEIEHLRVGRRILISKSAMEDFIKSHSRLGYS